MRLKTIKIEDEESNLVYLPVLHIKKASVNRYTGYIKILMLNGDIETLECGTDKLLLDACKALKDCGVRII